MKISVVSGAPQARATDVLVYPAFALPKPETATGAAAKKTKKKKKAAAKTGTLAVEPIAPGFGDHLVDVDQALGGLLLRTARAEGFNGNAGQLFVMHTHGRIPAVRIILVGMGQADRQRFHDASGHGAQGS